MPLRTVRRALGHVVQKGELLNISEQGRYPLGHRPSGFYKDRSCYHGSDKGFDRFREYGSVPIRRAVFVPQLPEYRGSTEFAIYGEMEIPIELEMLVKYG